MDTPRQRLYASRLQEAREQISRDCLTAASLDHWYPALTASGKLLITDLLEAHEGAHVQWCLKPALPGANTVGRRVMEAVVTELVAADSADEPGLPADPTKRLQELARLVKVYKEAESPHRRATRTVREALNAPTPAVARESNAKPKNSFDVAVLYENAEVQRGGPGFGIAYVDMPGEAAVKATHKAAQKQPPSLPQYDTTEWRREHEAGYVERTKRGKEKKPATAVDYLGEADAAAEAIILGWSFRSDQPGTDHINFDENQDKLGDSATDGVVCIGAKGEIIRSKFALLRRACDLGRLSRKKVRRAVKELYAAIETSLHETSSTLTVACQSHHVRDALEHVSSKAKMRADKARRAGEKKKRKRRRSRSTSPSCSSSSTSDTSESERSSESSSSDDSPVRRKAKRARSARSSARPTKGVSKRGPPHKKTKKAVPQCRFYRQGIKCPYEKSKGGCNRAHSGPKDK